jgi:hypothetical protein
MSARAGFGVIGVAMVLALAGALAAEPRVGASTFIQTAGAPAAQPAAASAQDNSPEAVMSRRFPQKVRVGDLIGLPMLDDNDVTLGRVQHVVRTPEGKIKLIVGYSKWFGWFGRPVAVPIEVVAILARQIASLDMPPSEYESAPTWSEGKDAPIPDDEIIRIALTRR